MRKDQEKLPRKENPIIFAVLNTVDCWITSVKTVKALKSENFYLTGQIPTRENSVCGISL